MVETIQDDRVEVLLALDDDDPRRHDYAPADYVEITKREPLGVRWNRLAEAANGAYLMLGGDDMRFLKEGWADSLVDDKLYGFNTGGTKEHFAFPIMPQPVYEVLGKFTSERISHLFVDTWINDVCQDIKHYLPHIPLKHERLGDKTTSERQNTNRGRSEYDATHAERVRLRAAVKLSFVRGAA